ncbi:unnamed protein product [Rotaria sp. Silwood2]|nr:unnamed protein product [Rotaria sp. Silwood2]CAF4399360.1 unnamed protein product [Rotaria sp. Silwood2]
MNQHYHFNYDSDKESGVDYLTDYINSDENDSYDDLENQILDYIGMKQFLAISSYNTEENLDEHLTNNDNHHRYS